MVTLCLTDIACSKYALITLLLLCLDRHSASCNVPRDWHYLGSSYKPMLDWPHLVDGDQCFTDCRFKSKYVVGVGPIGLCIVANGWNSTANIPRVIVLHNLVLKVILVHSRVQEMAPKQHTGFSHMRFAPPRPREWREMTTPPVAVGSVAGLLPRWLMLKKTEGHDPMICRDQSDLSKMPFYTHGGQCQPGLSAANRCLPVSKKQTIAISCVGKGPQNGGTRVFTQEENAWDLLLPSR
jgi:hypothetical protein